MGYEGAEIARSTIGHKSPGEARHVFHSFCFESPQVSIAMLSFNSGTDLSSLHLDFSNDTVLAETTWTGLYCPIVLLPLRNGVRWP